MSMLAEGEFAVVAVRHQICWRAVCSSKMISEGSPVMVMPHWPSAPVSPPDRWTVLRPGRP
jgi:hypothetical protein